MMTEISLNILDIAENSIRAQASLITISVRVDTQADKLDVTIDDNGCGMTPEGAYLAAHAAEILPAAMAYGAQYAREQLASSLMGGNRPEENGLSGGGAVKMDAGVGSLSRGEYDRICRMVAKGERISFG